MITRFFGWLYDKLCEKLGDSIMKDLGELEEWYD